MRANLLGPMCLWLFSMPAVAYGQQAAGQIVDKLATTIPPPVIQGEPGEQRAKYSKFDPAERDRVRALLSSLSSETEKLWPELVGHLQDHRYSLTVGSDAGYPTNWTVGEACQELIGSSLSVAYYRHLDGSKSNYHHYSLPEIAKDKAKLRTWCVARKDKKLYELQIECCEWALKEIGDSKMEAAVKERTSEAVRKEIAGLKKSRTAVPSTRSF